MSSKPRHKKKRRKPPVNLEPLFLEAKEALTHDLASCHIKQLLMKNERGKGIPLNEGVTPYLFKKVQQCLHFDKRIIWRSDRSFDDLSDEALQGFAASQKDFLCPEPMSQRASLVVHLAAELCQRIVGEFSYDEWFDSCSFGKRAAVDLPRRESYLDTRLTRSSGTPLQWSAFNEALSRDIHLFRAFRQMGKRPIRRTIRSAVMATAVPKSWKAARIIAPDTILGGFLSRGLGAMVRTQLEKNTHIDLAKQQGVHKRLAKKASIWGHLATIDMSKASDSFTWRHIEMLMPKSWHHALECVRTDNVTYPGPLGPVGVDLRSYMLMGSGHTFPLQTLLFYCLAEATRMLLKSAGMVSVYGDDIIIPIRTSQYFLVIMSELGFVINKDKSFYDVKDPDRPSQTFFRESCGGDFKGGIDVRPYMPECDLQSDGMVSSNEYLAWCHRLLNGFLDRWDVEEIPSVVALLLRSINRRGRKVCFVPTWEVDHAGIRHYIPPHHLFGIEFSRMSHDASVPTYWRLTYKQVKRPRTYKERPYQWYSYWLSVRKPRSKRGWTFKKELGRVVDPYDTPISLTGEPNKGRKGTYCWKMKGPGVIE